MIPRFAIRALPFESFRSMNDRRIAPLQTNMPMKTLPLLCLAALAALTTGAPSSFAKSAYVKPAAPLEISHGQKVDLKDYVVPGKTTIFDFMSAYCPPCRAIAPHLAKLHANRADIVVVEVDINRPDVKGIDWRSPVAQQYGMRSIPHFKVFNPDGKLQAEGDDAYHLVTSWFKE
jgi:thiol-disulfide isomerase/thioredoxin